jgi:glycosyltransferase involved in cell wall biosynthesis
MTSAANGNQVRESPASPALGSAPALRQEQSRPPVSVIIPAYNSALSLGAAIQSVLDQSYSEFEILVIDDGSTDDTEGVARSFGNRVSYFRQENGGAGAARNQGIARSQGKYVAFLDSDDVWLPTKLAEQIPMLDRDAEIGLVYTDWAVVPEQGEPEPSVLSKLPAASGYVFEQLVQCGFILTSGTVVRRSCLDEIGDFDEHLSIAQDYDLWLRISYRWKVALLNKPLVIKKNREGNLSSNLPKTAAERIVLFQKALSNFPEMPRHTRRLIKVQVALNYWDLGYLHFENMSLPEARKNFASSLKYDWTNARSLSYLAASYMPSQVANVARTIKRVLS